jgi:hypothetical protein
MRVNPIRVAVTTPIHPRPRRHERGEDDELRDRRRRRRGRRQEERAKAFSDALADARGSLADA